MLCNAHDLHDLLRFSDRADTGPTAPALSQMLLLGVALTVGQFLERNNINWMSEAGGALIVGIVLGLVVTLANNVSHWYSDFFKFDVRAHALCSRAQHL